LTVCSPAEPTVARLRCFRGIETLSALVLHLEVGDFARFQRPGQLAAWLGLVPSLHQSGESETRGSITKTGSSFARRILVEAAWHYLREPRIGATLRDRHAGQPDHILQIAWRAQHRLYRLQRRLRTRGKPGTSSSPPHASWPASSGRQAWPTDPTPPTAAVRKTPWPKLPARAKLLWATLQGDARS
jgi:Transposase IS116/IS110/IS902 family